MGLDARGHESATLVDDHGPEWCEDGNHVTAFIVDPTFHRSIAGLTANRCYEVSGKSAHVGNSYGGHREFRDLLARAFLGLDPRSIWSDPDAHANLPFFELIHFADNEGTIGPEASSSLYNDFFIGRPLWLQRVSDDWNRQKYDEWTEVFRVASRGGLVRFA